MNKKCCARLDDYFDGELSPAETDDLLQHAEDCPHCWAILEEQACIDELLLTAWQAITLPRDLARSAPLSKTDASCIRRRRSYRRALLATAAAAGLVLAPLVWHFGRQVAFGPSAGPVVGSARSDSSGGNLPGERQTVRSVVVTTHHWHADAAAHVYVGQQSIALPVIQDADVTAVVIYPTAHSSFDLDSGDSS